MKALSTLLRQSWLACIPGGALWALSPLGVSLSESRFKTPNVFWELFPTAPLLLAVGLIGLYLLHGNRWNWLARAAFWLALSGIVFIVAGDVGLLYMDVDNAYIMTAPAYHAFRAGLLAFGLAWAWTGLVLLIEGLWPRLVQLGSRQTSRAR